MSPYLRKRPLRTAMHTFIDAFNFIGNNSHLLWTKTLAHLEISFAALGVASVAVATT